MSPPPHALLGAAQHYGVSGAGMVLWAPPATAKEELESGEAAPSMEVNPCLRNG